LNDDFCFSAPQLKRDPLGGAAMRAVGFVLKSFGAVLLIAVVTGSTDEQIGQRRDRRRLPQIGRSVDIGGRTLNIYCSGNGSPVVILDAGAGDGNSASARRPPYCRRWVSRYGG